jgi:hypothetical protein
LTAAGLAPRAGPEQIASQARDALMSAVEAGAALPPSIEDGVIPPYDLGDYQNPLVVLVPYEASAPVALA